MMLPKEYATFSFNGEKAYVRKDRLSELRRVDGVIFDCDGVLIDIRDSYNKAISKAVAFIFEGLTGYAFPESFISNEVIFLFRRSGGFNNDWDTVYGILMFLLVDLPEKIRCQLKELMETVEWQPDPFGRFSSIRDVEKKDVELTGLSSEVLKGMIIDLKEFTQLLDATGIASVDERLVGDCGVSKAFSQFYNVVKRFLCYPADVGKSIIARVFEEFYCGLELFQKTYGMEPKFHRGLGMVENEKLIIRPEALDHLTRVLGKAKLGIASGSHLEPARHVLGKFLDRFNLESSVFLETMEEAERQYLREEGLEISLKKPHPFSLLKAVEAYGPNDTILYVGDSMEDALMVKEARNLGKPFLFAGVYRYSGVEDALLHCFLKSGCDMVIPSVNELPYALEALGRDWK